MNIALILSILWLFICAVLELILFPFLGFYFMGSIGFIFSILLLRSCSKTRIQFMTRSCICIAPICLLIFITLSRSTENYITQKLFMYFIQWIVAVLLATFSSFRNSCVFYPKDIILCFSAALIPFLLLFIYYSDMLAK